MSLHTFSSSNAAKATELAVAEDVNQYVSQVVNMEGLVLTPTHASAQDNTLDLYVKHQFVSLTVTMEHAPVLRLALVIQDTQEIVVDWTLLSVLMGTMVVVNTSVLTLSVASHAAVGMAMLCLQTKELAMMTMNVW